MKLSISNLAWNYEDNEKVYSYLSKKKFSGIEIAPTKIFGESPYECIDEAIDYFRDIKNRYGLEVCSMQSIWYGKTGNIFVNDERGFFLNYTHSAIKFAEAIGCGNLVFGNPKARNMGENNKVEDSYEFFKDISDYAYEHNTTLSLEPNPAIYNTNFINHTQDAFNYCKGSGCDHLKVNVDFGTILCNGESLSVVADNIDLVNHIHISEPYMKKIEPRSIHKELLSLPYNKYVSIEMGLQDSVQEIFDVVDYVAEVLGT